MGFKLDHKEYEHTWKVSGINYQKQLTDSWSIKLIMNNLGASPPQNWI